MATGLYRGYSSFEYQRKKTFSLDDIELVNMDLLNHIFTRRGERVMMPTFGTRIPDMVFEPLDQVTLNIVREDLQSVFKFDPRVQLLDLTITPNFDVGAIVASAKLRYIELNMVDILTLNITFEGQQQ